MGRFRSSPVIEFKRNLVEETEHYHFLEKSIFDYSWLDDVKRLLNLDSFEMVSVLFIAEGLFIYFTETQVKEIFLHLMDACPQAEIIFEVYFPEPKFIFNSQINYNHHRQPSHISWKRPLITKKIAHTIKRKNSNCTKQPENRR